MRTRKILVLAFIASFLVLNFFFYVLPGGLYVRDYSLTSPPLYKFITQILISVASIIVSFGVLPFIRFSLEEK